MEVNVLLADSKDHLGHAIFHGLVGAPLPKLQTKASTTTELRSHWALVSYLKLEEGFAKRTG